MTVFLVLLIPVLLMVFALLMERLENRLHTPTMSEQEVEEFLDQAHPDEVNTFVREGWSRALSMFRLRRRRPRRPATRKSAPARSSSGSDPPAPTSAEHHPSSPTPTRQPVRESGRRTT